MIQRVRAGLTPLGVVAVLLVACGDDDSNDATIETRRDADSPLDQPGDEQERPLSGDNATGDDGPEAAVRAPARAFDDLDCDALVELTSDRAYTARSSSVRGLTREQHLESCRTDVQSGDLAPPALPGAEQTVRLFCEHDGHAVVQIRNADYEDLDYVYVIWEPRGWGMLDSMYWLLEEGSAWLPPSLTVDPEVASGAEPEPRLELLEDCAELPALHAMYESTS